MLVTTTNIGNSFTDWNKTKKEAIARQPLIVDMPLSKFDLGENQTLKIDGKIMPVSDKAYWMFLNNILGVDSDFADRFKKATDSKTQLSMLQVLKTGLVRMGNQSVNMIANKEKRTIIGFNPANKRYLTNEVFISLIEMVMNKYPNLLVRQFNVDEHGGLKILSNTENMVTFNEISSAERFLGGLTFMNDAENGASFGFNLLRIICENGMMHDMEDFSKFKIGQDPKSIDLFLKAIQKRQENDFVSGFLKNKIAKANEVEASVRELEFARKFILDNSTLGEANINSFLPITSVQQDLARKGIEYANLDKMQAAMCPTGIKLWDVVNVVTDFGSHDYGFNANSHTIQKQAGGLFFRKKFDGESFLKFN